ncbi:MAG TPA: penicillin-binding protein [Chitinophagales bacterium]|nr:penicillin-binding protein [Chitinophagales bacterium]
MSIKRAILLRIYLAFFAICLLGVAILARAFHIQRFEGTRLITMADSLTTDYLPIDAERGNILSEDGRVLASSLPYYEVRFDVNAEALSRKIFEEHVDSLAWYLSRFKGDNSQKYYQQILRNARSSGSRYFLIARNVTYPELQQMKKWPLFRLGRYKGGFIAVQTNKRTMPYQMLAHRTIGYVREGVKPVGLEGNFDKQLAGIRGKRLMQRIAGGTWIPVNDENEIMPEHGKDIITTLDINLQDVAENALLKALYKHNADHGCVVVMEVKTGKIRAIANLGIAEHGDYWETYNYAVGEAAEPGSTMKLVSLLALLEDGYMDINDTVDLEKGVTHYHNVKMEDSEEHHLRKVSVREAFEISSNVGISKIISKHYGLQPEKFVKHLRDLHLNEKLDIEIDGEAAPLIKGPENKGWSGTSLPWMAIGYEMMVTPLQMLMLYNAVANEGKMMKPYLVSGIQERGKVVEKFEPQVVDEKICSDKTLKKLKVLLEGVVQNGTADHLKSPYYSFAGKTGTALIADKKSGYKRNLVYQSSFVGYFPADNPIYSCIVVINAPKMGMYYGGYVAAPVFREIADKVFSNYIDMHEPVNKRKEFYTDVLPKSKGGYRHDVSTIYEQIGVSCNYTPEDEWIYTVQKDNSFELKQRSVKKGFVPDVRGMGLRDALYLLENEGMTVRFSGIGKVKTQSIRYGSKAYRGMEIFLELG